MNTEIEIPIAQLKSVMPGLSKIVSRSSNLPVLQCVKVELSQDEKSITLQAHNLNEVATARLENKANGLSGQMLVPLDMLSKIIKGCPTDQSIRLIASKEETKIRYPVAGSFVDRILTHTPIQEWPAVKLIDKEPTPMDAAVKVAIREAMECASIDSSRYVLNGACLDVRDKDAHYVIGTDGRHLYSANSFTFKLPEHLIIPSSKFMAWPAFAADGVWQLRMLPAVKVDEKEKDPAKKNEEPPWFQIDSDHWSYQARAIDGQFPNWKQVIPGDTVGWTNITLQPSAVTTILDALPLLPGNEEMNRSITLAAGNGLLVKAKGKDQADWTKIDVPEVSVLGKAVEIALNRGYLIRALRFGLHQIAILDSLSPLIFTAPGKTMIVMPIRLEGPCEPPPAAQSATGAQPISQNENTPAAPPSAPGVNDTTEERKQSMSTTTMTAPERGNIRAHASGTNGQEENAEKRSAFKTALEHIERIKTNLRDVIADLSDAVALLKTAEKEQRSSAKEIEAVRAKLRELQSVEI
jgi:DNA polymerase III sliding clamp (beta) subunit (PCNA family)